MEKATLDDLTSFATAGGSAIRELAGPAWTPARHQSLAAATVAPGGETAERYHPRTSAQPLVLLCCCAPPYSDDDTILTGG